MGFPADVKRMAQDFGRSQGERTRHMNGMRADMKAWLKRTSAERRRSAQEARQSRARWFGELRSCVKDMRSRAQTKMGQFRNEFAEAHRAWTSRRGPSPRASSSEPSRPKPSDEAVYTTPDEEPERKRRKGRAQEE